MGCFSEWIRVLRYSLDKILRISTLSMANKWVSLKTKIQGKNQTTLKSFEDYNKFLMNTNILH